MKTTNKTMMMGLAAGLLMVWAASTALAADRYQGRYDNDRDKNFRSDNYRDGGRDNWKDNDRNWKDRDRNDKYSRRDHDRDYKFGRYDRDRHFNDGFVGTSRCSNSCWVLRHHNANCPMFYAKPRCDKPVYVGPVYPERSGISISIYGW